jgi:DNA-binding CsgD family transcriptional regulator
LISADNTYDEVATALGITKNGVRFHIKNIYIKLNVKNRLEAVRKWINQF